MKLPFIVTLAMLMLILCCQSNQQANSQSNSQSQQIFLPVSELLLYKINMSIKRMEILLEKLGTTQDAKQKIWHRTELTKRYLNDVRRELQNYNAVSIGKNNQIQGEKNIVFGNQNNLQGHQNWVFVSDFAGKVNGNLIVGKWKIDLNMTQYIPVNPGMAISFINDDKNKELVQRLYSKNRQFVQWGEWAQPSQQTKKIWGNYAGFNQWTSTFEKKLLNWILQQWEKTTPTQPYVPNNYQQTGQQVIQQTGQLIGQQQQQQVSQQNGYNLRQQNQSPPNYNPYYPYFQTQPIISPGTNWILIPNPFVRY